MTIIHKDNLLWWFNTNVVAVIFCCLAAMFYSLLAHAFPPVYWYDAHIRLALRDQIFLGHWLPLIQILIVLVSKFTHDLLVLRILLAVLAGCVLLCAFVFMRRLFSTWNAFIAMIFLATNLMFTSLAIVPYPEILFIGLLLLSLNLLEDLPSGRYFYWGMLALNLACLTRYEGWLLVLIIVMETALQSLQTRNWRLFFQVALLSGIVPLGWLVLGVSGSGNLLDRFKTIIAFEVMTDTKSLGTHFLAHLNLDYLKAFANNYYHLLSWQAGSVIVFLGAFGWIHALLFAEHRALHKRIFAFIILDWFLLALWQPWDFTNLRTAFIGQVFLVLYAAYGLQQLSLFIFHGLTSILQNINMLNWQGWVATALVLIYAYGSASSAVRFVELTSRENDFSNPARVGIWLKMHLNRQDGILVLTDDVFQPYALATYTGLPYSNILDDRFDSQQLSSSLMSSQMVYVVELYRTRDGLSAEETNLLNELDDGGIQAQLFTVGPTRVWFASKDEINMLKVVHN